MSDDNKSKILQFRSEKKPTDEFPEREYLLQLLSDAWALVERGECRGLFMGLLIYKNGGLVGFDRMLCRSLTQVENLTLAGWLEVEKQKLLKPLV
jgi:hypothetical protein